MVCPGDDNPLLMVVNFGYGVNLNLLVMYYKIKPTWPDPSCDGPKPRCSIIVGRALGCGNEQEEGLWREEGWL